MCFFGQVNLFMYNTNKLLYELLAGKLLQSCFYYTWISCLDQQYFLYFSNVVTRFYNKDYKFITLLWFMVIHVCHVLWFKYYHSLNNSVHKPLKWAPRVCLGLLLQFVSISYIRIFVIDTSWNILYLIKLYWSYLIFNI